MDTGRGGGDTSPRFEGDSDPILRVQNLRKTYKSGSAAITAVDDVSFEVDSGSIVGLLGHNGAGKTTIIKMILGIISSTSGTVSITGEDVHDNPRAAYRHVAAVLEGARNVYWRLTVRENLEFFARLGGNVPSDQRDRHDQLLRQLDIDDRADTTVNELSRGMKQKVSLATMLARRPDILFLDEPTLGLDVGSSLTLRQEIQRLVSENNMTVFVSSHDMDLIEELCDRVIVLNEGEIVADDSVDVLLDLFESHDLQLTIEGTVPDGFRSTLESAFDVDSWDGRGDRIRLRVSVVDGEEIHRIVGTVLDAGLRIVELETRQMDFEDVYLGLTEGSDDSPPSVVEEGVTNDD